MKKIAFFICFFITAFCAEAQGDSSFQLIKTLNEKVTDVAVDNLGNIYLLTASDAIKKLNAAGDSVGIFNEVKRFGKLTSIIVSNPLKILLYYKDFSKVVILDRQLSVRSVIDLRKLNIIQTSAIGLSYDNNIWLFDEYENKLKRISEDGTILMQTDDFRNIFSSAFIPLQIIDENEFVYLYDAASGVLVFDHYGTYKKKIPITGWRNIAVANTYILGTEGSSIHYYNTSTLLQRSKDLPLNSVDGFNYYIRSNKIFAWSKDGLRIYTNPF